MTAFQLHLEDSLASTTQPCTSWRSPLNSGRHSYTSFAATFLWSVTSSSTLVPIKQNKDRATTSVHASDLLCSACKAPTGPLSRERSYTSISVALNDLGCHTLHELGKLNELHELCYLHD